MGPTDILPDADRRVYFDPMSASLTLFDASHPEGVPLADDHPVLLAFGLLVATKVLQGRVPAENLAVALRLREGLEAMQAPPPPQGPIMKRMRTLQRLQQRDREQNEGGGV